MALNNLEAFKMAETSLSESTQNALQHLVDKSVELETAKRVDKLANALSTFKAIEKVAKKIQPDVVVFDHADKPIITGFSKVAMEKNKKTREVKGKLEEALNAIISGANDTQEGYDKLDKAVKEVANHLKSEKPAAEEPTNQ